VEVRADFLGVSLAGHGPITGAHGRLQRRCVASEALWTLEHNNPPAGAGRSLKSTAAAGHAAAGAAAPAPAPAPAAAAAAAAGAPRHPHFSYVQIMLPKSGAAVTDTAWRGLFEVGRRAQARAVLRVERRLRRAERKLRMLLHRAN